MSADLPSPNLKDSSGDFLVSKMVENRQAPHLQMPREGLLKVKKYILLFD
jgi:hypothetical protein